MDHHEHLAPPPPPRKKRGGGDTHRLAGRVGVVVHLEPAEHAALVAAARATKRTVKEYVRVEALCAAGMQVEPRPDTRGSLKGLG